MPQTSRAAARRCARAAARKRATAARGPRGAPFGRSRREKKYSGTLIGFIKIRRNRSFAHLFADQARPVDLENQRHQERNRRVRDHGMQREIERRGVLRVERRPKRAQQIHAQNQRADLGENLEPVGRFARERLLRELRCRAPRSLLFACDSAPDRFHLLEFEHHHIDDGIGLHGRLQRWRRAGCPPGATFSCAISAASLACWVRSASA